MYSSYNILLYLLGLNLLRKQQVGRYQSSYNIGYKTKLGGTQCWRRLSSTLCGFSFHQHRVWWLLEPHNHRDVWLPGGTSLGCDRTQSPLWYCCHTFRLTGCVWKQNKLALIYSTLIKYQTICKLDMQGWWKIKICIPVHYGCDKTRTR